MTENIESNCNTISQRGGVERLKGYIESLDSRLAQLEKGVSCLNLTRDLLTDWVYQNTVIRKDELPQYYSGADVFLFPSRKEGMPNAVLEAMSYGLPIIMTPCQGSDELIDGNGYVVTVADFGGKILELVKNQKNRKAMGQRSIELVRDVFSWKSTSDKYLNLFSEVIKKNI